MEKEREEGRSRETNSAAHQVPAHRQLGADSTGAPVRSKLCAARAPVNTTRRLVLFGTEYLSSPTISASSLVPSKPRAPSQVPPIDRRRLFLLHHHHHPRGTPMEYDFRGRPGSGSGSYAGSSGGGSSLYPRVGQPSHGGGSAPLQRPAPYLHPSAVASPAPNAPAPASSSSTSSK